MRLPASIFRFALFLAVAINLPASGTSAFAQEESGAAADRAAAAEANLPIKRIVMFNSGVAFFEHKGEIDGDATVNLKFNVDDVNDLLKSMVLQDDGGGKIKNVNYASRDPITKTLKTFAIDLTENPTLANLLGQIRGEAVRVQAPSNVEGSIVGVETRKQKVGDELIDVQVLNLLTDEGLRSIPLDTIGSIKLLDADLNAELNQALMILAASHSQDKKTVTLEFTGAGQRGVRVGYVQEAPIWKTSYRLVLGEDAPLVQGWAIVENTTEEDWEDVDLTLVSGRPISFMMDLYQPLYIPRPMVEPELFASLRPQNYDQDLVGAEGLFLGRAVDARNKDKEAPARSRAGLAPAAPMEADGNGRFRGMGGGSGGGGGGLAGEANFAFDPSSGVSSVAQGGDVGELFEYHISAPVALPRQQSAMLPIVNDSVQAEKVSIYNPGVQAKHPLNGLRLTNTSGVHLMQGPVTVFDDGVYAGDAQIPDMPPSSERLLSYALDLNTEVAPESETTPARLTSCVIKNGVMQISNKYERSTSYTVKNSGDREKKVLIEYGKDENWKLVTPEEPAETTRDMYRFAVNASPGVPAELKVTEERVISQQIALTNANDDQISFYINARTVDQSVKDALAEIITRKNEINRLNGQMQQHRQMIETIGQEQARIRENMAQLGRNTELYNRYVQKFSDQEKQIEELRQKIADLQGQIKSKQDSLNDYLQALTIG